jgi:hypothetical protein
MRIRGSSIVPLLSGLHDGVEKQGDQDEANHKHNQARNESAFRLRGFRFLTSSWFEFGHYEDGTKRPRRPVQAALDRSIAR